ADRLRLEEAVFLAYAGIQKSALPWAPACAAATCVDSAAHALVIPTEKTSPRERATLEETSFPRTRESRKASSPGLPLARERRTSAQPHIRSSLLKPSQASVCATSASTGRVASTVNVGAGSLSPGGSRSFN